MDAATLRGAMGGQDVVYANLAGPMAQQASAIIEAMHAEGVKRLIFISPMGIDSTKAAAESGRERGLVAKSEPWPLTRGPASRRHVGWAQVPVHARLAQTSIVKARSSCFRSGTGKDDAGSRSKLIVGDLGCFNEQRNAEWLRRMNPRPASI